jgi:hypothetical protein
LCRKSVRRFYGFKLPQPLKTLQKLAIAGGAKAPGQMNVEHQQHRDDDDKVAMSVRDLKEK